MSAHKHTLLYTLVIAAFMLPLNAEAKKDADGPSVCDDCPDYSGWSGWVEGGLGAQSNDDYHFGRYTGREENGGTLNASGDVAYHGKDGYRAEVKATDLGLTSRDLQLDAGKQGKAGISLEYDQIPNYRLHLPTTDLKTERDRSGVKFNFIPQKNWEVTGYFRHEKKDGTRDLGAGFVSGSISVLPAPIDYQTDDFGVTLGYKGRKLQGELAYTGSLFRNGQDAITFADPYAAGTNGAVAEAPDNQFHQLSGLLGYQVSDHTRIGANLAMGRMTQNQAFLPYSANATTMPTTSSLDGRVDTTQARVNVNSRPGSRWQLNASYSYSNRDDKTAVNTYQDVVTDTTALGSPRTNRPYSFEQRLLRTSAAYILPRGANLSAGFDDDQNNRSYQPVQQTVDKTVWSKLKLHPTESIETTLKYSYSTRDASSPVSDGTPAAYANNPLMNAFEYADRRRDKLGIEFSASPLPKLSVDLSLDYYRDGYPNTVLGLTGANGVTATPSATYVFSERLSSSLYYTYEKLDSGQASQFWMPSPATSTPWAESDSNLTQTVGLNFSWKAITKKLEIVADLVYSDYAGKMHYAGTTDLPDLASKMTSLGIHGSYKLKDNLSLRAGYRFERYTQSDWALNGGTVTNLLTLGVAAQPSQTNLATVSLRYDFK